MLQPPLLRSLWVGATVVGRSPTILATACVGVLALWLVYSSSGLIRVASPGVMALLESLPPLHALVDSTFVLTATRVFSPPDTLALAALLLVLRSALVAYWLSETAETLMGSQPQGGSSAIEASGTRPASDENEPPATTEAPRQAPWRLAAGAARGRAVRALPSVLGIEALFLALVLVLPSILGALLGTLGLVVALLAVMFFLVFAPVVAVVERASLRDALRLSVRAARARGPQHVVLVFPYLVAGLFLLVEMSRGVHEATPSVLVWAAALLANLAHVALLAALVERWRLLRDPVLAASRATREPTRAGRDRRSGAAEGRSTGRRSVVRDRGSGERRAR